MTTSTQRPERSTAALAHLPLPVADDATVHAAAAQAVERGWHLVIDRDGRAKITPRIFPGMQVLKVAGERDKVAA